MKKILIFTAALMCLSIGQNAFSSLSNTTCWSGISVNSGHLSRHADDNSAAGAACECTQASQADFIHSYSTFSGSCPTGWCIVSPLAVGGNCCMQHTGLCNREPQQPNESTVNTASDHGLDEVFSDRSTKYFGLIDAISRSPGLGRTLLIEAKLDVCLGDATVDALPTNYPNDPYGAWSACTGSSYCGSTLKNTYCTQNSSRVCVDRCNCKYQAQLISLGYPDPGCTNL